MALGVLGSRKLAYRLFNGPAPGVVSGDVEVVVVGVISGEILAKRLGRHPGVVGLPEHVRVTLGPGGGVRVGEGTEVNPVAIPGGFARGNGNGAGHAAEHHLDALTVDKLCGVFCALSRFATGISDHQLQLATHDTAGLVDFVNGQEGAKTLLQALILVATGLRVVQADFQGLGIDSGARQQQQASRKEYFSDLHSGWPPELQRQWRERAANLFLIIC